MTYYTVPADVLEDSDELVKWARKSVAAALAKGSR
jgi:TfoX/Sxy family transcriptional regulator of competence genes